MPVDPYYKRDLALVHHLGFGFHADMCAPGILDFLEPVRESGGLVLEVGCGSGLLTKHLVDSGHRVLATDASPAMLELARSHAVGAEAFQRLTLPDDPIPEADAIVSTGHALSYLDDEESIFQALLAIARAVPPGGLFALDICDLQWGEARRDAPPQGGVGEDWAIVTRFSMPSPRRFDREMTTFIREPDGSWRREDEFHANVLIDTSKVPGLLSDTGLEVEIRDSFGAEELPVGLKVVVGRRAARG